MVEICDHGVDCFSWYVSCIAYMLTRLKLNFQYFSALYMEPDININRTYSRNPTDHVCSSHLSVSAVLICSAASWELAVTVQQHEGDTPTVRDCHIRLTVFKATALLSTLKNEGYFQNIHWAATACSCVFLRVSVSIIFKWRKHTQSRAVEKHTDRGHEATYFITFSDPLRLWKANWYKHGVADDSKKMVDGNYVAEALSLHKH